MRYSNVVTDTVQQLLSDYRLQAAADSGIRRRILSAKNPPKNIDIRIAK